MRAFLLLSIVVLIAGLMAGQCEGAAKTCAFPRLRRAYYGIPGGYNVAGFTAPPSPAANKTLIDVTTQMNNYIECNSGNANALVNLMVAGIPEPFVGTQKTLILVFQDGSVSAGVQGGVVKLLDVFPSCPNPPYCPTCPTTPCTKKRSAPDETSSFSSNQSTTTTTTRPDSQQQLPFANLPANNDDNNNNASSRAHQQQARNWGFNSSCVAPNSPFSPGVIYWGVPNGLPGANSINFANFSGSAVTLNSYICERLTQFCLDPYLSLTDVAPGYVKKFFYYGESLCADPFAAYFTEGGNQWFQWLPQLQGMLGGWTSLNNRSVCLTDNMCMWN